MPNASLFQVDAFSDEPFSGNPAAVCLLDSGAEWPADDWLQAFAAEMNLSETAYLLPNGSDYDLRWFTPGAEVDLCGHATLATAHVLWSNGLTQASSVRFHSRSGLLTAERKGDFIELDFPAKPAAPCDVPEGLLAALDIENPIAVEQNAFDFLVQLEREAQVIDLAPNYRDLARVDCRGVIVTAPADESAEYDFISRFFAPHVGIDEDPVTGSAHCCLGPYWSPKLEKSSMIGRQASPRGGRVHVQIVGDRVKLGGQAVTIFQGSVNVP